MEELRMLVSIIKAENLEDVNRFSRMKPFARVKISPIDLTYSTRVDEAGGVNPRWHETFAFMMPEAYLRDGSARATVEIWTEATVGNKEVGEVTIPLTELAAAAGTSSTKVTRIYDIRSKGKGELRGQLHVGFASGASVQVAPVARPGGPAPGSTLSGARPARVPESSVYYPSRPQTPPAEPLSYPGPPSEPPSYHPPPPASHTPPPTPSYLPPSDEPPSYYPPPARTPPLDQPPSYYPPPSPTPPPDQPLPLIERPPFDKPVFLPPKLSQAQTPPSRPGQVIPFSAPIPVTPPPYVNPPPSTTGVFSKPLGKILLTDLNVKTRPQRPY